MRTFKKNTFTLLNAVTTLLFLAASSHPGWAAEQQLDFIILPAKPAVRLGDPIMVSVRVTNRAPLEAQAYRASTAFDCFEITSPQGEVLPYVGFDGQIAANPIQVAPHSTATIADLDLTDKYIFQNPGRYLLRFKAPAGLQGQQPSTVEITLTPGQLSEFDLLATALLSVCPKAWHLAKDARGEVAPFGRTRSDGLNLHLCHNHMKAEAVYLWFTRDEAKTDSSQPQRLNTDFLGRASGLYVYAAVDKNTPPLWPTVIEDISQALKITKKN